MAARLPLACVLRGMFVVGRVIGGLRRLGRCGELGRGFANIITGLLLLGGVVRDLPGQLLGVL